MALSTKHSFVSAKADGVDSTLVQPSSWNAEHVLTAAAGKVLGTPTGSTTVSELPITVDASLQTMTPPKGGTGSRPTGVTGMFRYNTDTNQFEGYNGSWGSIGGAGGNITSGTATGNGSTTTFNLGVTPPSIYSVVWEEGGKIQVPGVDYTISGTNLTRTTAPLNGVAIIWYCFGSAVAVNVPAAASITDSMVSGSAHIAFTNAVQIFTVPQVPGSSALTSGAAADFTTKQKWVATVNGGTFTITNPSAATTDAFYEIRISYTTSNSVAWGTNFKGISSVTWTATAGAVDIALFQYNGSTFELVGYSLNAGA